MLRKTVIVATSVVAASALLTVCPSVPPPDSTATTSSSSTVGTPAPPPPPKPCPTASATTSVGPDSLTESPIGSWGVGGITGQGAYAATVVGNTVYVAGVFSQAIPPSGSPVARSNIAAFCLATGQLLDVFVADTNGPVWALTNDGTNVFAGGDFTTLNGQPSNRLVKLDPLTGKADTTTFKPPAIPGPIYALDYSSVTGDVFAGGDFRIAGLAAGNPMKGASFDATKGTFAGWNPKADGRIDSLKVSGDGKNVFIGGNFKNIGQTGNTVPRDNMARTAASNGALDPTVYGENGGILGAIGARVLSLAVDADNVSPFAATGPVSPVGTATGGGNKLLGLDADGTERFRVRPFNGDVQAVVLIDNTVYAGFHDGFTFPGTGVSDTTKRVIGFTKTNGAITAFQPAANGHPLGVRGLATDANGRRLIAVGDFTFMGTTSQLHGLAIFP